LLTKFGKLAWHPSIRGWNAEAEEEAGRPAKKRKTRKDKGRHTTRIDGVAPFVRHIKLEPSEAAVKRLADIKPEPKKMQPKKNKDKRKAADESSQLSPAQKLRRKLPA